ncbi:MAG: transcription elongation factor GreA [Tissierellia bacterium]|nr:transcription elongation factor GreA [Tissierellia bacterium]
MIEEKVLLTKEGYEKLKTELEYLVTQKRGEVSEKIKIARGFGDLSENAEYDEAKAEQASVEERIKELENQIENAEIIQKKDNDSDVKKVNIGDTVKILDLKKDKEMILSIVGTIEADIAENKISNESPVGRGLLNKTVGEIVDVVTKVTTIQYKILEIVR